MWWRQWMTRPQSTWLRKAIFQIHLWAGLALGFYITVVCVSGSAVVFRNDIYNELAKKIQVKTEERTLTRSELERALQPVFPGYAIRDVTRGRDSDEASEVLLARGRSEVRRLVNPYTGEDRGPAVSGWFRVLRWLSDLHGSLLLGTAGMTANAIGGALTAALCLTGLVVWWPGVANWRRSLGIRRSGWKRMTWDLHSAVGFWSFAFLFMWGATGAYFVFPQPFRAAIELFTPINPPRVPQPQYQRPPQASSTFPLTLPRRRRPLTPGGKIIRGFSLAHYGNFAGWPLKALWVLLGLVPLVLWSSALVMWWNRVVWPAVRHMRTEAAGQHDVVGRLQDRGNSAADIRE
jgi:uncharacterized iron-regulated membrane protein